MGIFSVLNGGKNFNLTKSDFKTEKKSYYDAENSPPISEELTKDIAEWKKQNGIKDRETNQTNESTTCITHVSLFRKKVVVTYYPDELTIDENDFIAGINDRMYWIYKNKNEIDNIIIDRLLSLKNEDWLTDDEEVLSKNEFIKRIKVASIMFFDDLSLEIMFDDGGLFWKHVIVVRLDKDKNLTDAFIDG